MVSPRKRTKIFNRLLNEFLSEYRKLYPNFINSNNIDSHIKVETFDFLTSFKSEIEFVKNDFLNCNETCFNNISLCKRLHLEKLQDFVDENPNKITVWKYLHQLYILTLENEEEREESNKISKKALEKLQETGEQSVVSTGLNLSRLNLDGLIGSLQSNKEMNSLIQEVSGKLTKSLEGKDLDNFNPMDLMSNLLGNSNGNNSLGINFQDILKDVTETIQTKVSKGELNIDNLKNEAKNMINTNPAFKHNEEIQNILKKDKTD